MDDASNDSKKSFNPPVNQGSSPPQENKSDWLTDNSGNSSLTSEEASGTDTGSQPPPSPSETQPPDAVKKEEEVRVYTPPENAMTSSPIVGPHTSSGGGGFRVFVIIGVVIIIAVWSFVAYLYFQNRSKNVASDSEITETPQNVVSPTPEFTPDQIKIKSGSVVREKPGSETVILINKENYPSTGITGFLKVNVSPDNKFICFESWPPAPEPALYVSDIDGNNVAEVSPNRQSCLWSKDSKNIFYINTSAKTAPINIFEYNLETKIETDLTSKSVPSGTVRRYELVGLSADASKIICRYESLGGAAETDNIKECEVNLETGEVSSL